MDIIARPIVASMGTVIDTDTKLSRSEAQALYQAGVRAIMRYVFFGPPRPGDIGLDEMEILLEEGHTVVLMQHPREPKANTLNAATGSSDIQWAIRNAVAVGYDPTRLTSADLRLSLGLDMEGLANPGAGPNAHSTLWCQGSAGAAFGPAVYTGYDPGLTKAQLDALPGNPVFLCDAAPFAARPTPTKSYAWHQRPTSTIAGVSVDQNIVLQDGAVVGLAAA
jgi:hypothetical protein